MQDPNILARKVADRWMMRTLGFGLFNRPLWRRETEDPRRLLLSGLRKSTGVTYPQVEKGERGRSSCDVTNLMPSGAVVQNVLA